MTRYDIPFVLFIFLVGFVQSKARDMDISSGECEDGWIPYADHCYNFSNNKMSWYDAKKYCNKMKGYLARAETQKESKWLQVQARILTREYTWMGGTDAGHEGVWKWESDGENVGYRDFHKSQPDNGSGKEHCLEMHGSGVTSSYQWNDLACNISRKFVCEKDMKKYDCLSNGNRKHLTIVHNYEKKE